jgi:hypothetical protein
MLRLQKWLGAAALGCVVAGGWGCTINDGNDDDVIIVEEATGALTVRWLVAGTTDPLACYDFFASEIELALYDPSGALWSVEYGACEWFETTIELPAGDWSIDATLVDIDLIPVSTTVAADVRVFADSEAVIDFDFPVDSML